jgi:hypothetical protein
MREEDRVIKKYSSWEEEKQKRKGENQRGNNTVRKSR